MNQRLLITLWPRCTTGPFFIPGVSAHGSRVPRRVLLHAAPFAHRPGSLYHFTGIALTRLSAAVSAELFCEGVFDSLSGAAIVETSSRCSAPPT